MSSQPLRPTIPPRPQKTDDKLAQTQNKINQIIPIMHQNIEIAISNGEKIDELDGKATILAEESVKFRDGARRVRRHFCCQHIKMVLLIALIVLVIIGILIAVYYPRN